MTKTRRLELFRQIESILRHGEALVHRTRKQQDVLGVAVGEERGGKNVALRGARRQAGGRPDALDVPDHSRNFGVVGEAGKLRHQRDAGPGGRGHGARARPTRAHHHADRSQFVFRLHDGESSLAVGADAEALHVVNHRSRAATRRRNGIPGHHGGAGEHAAQSGGGVAVDDDLALRSCPCAG